MVRVTYDYQIFLQQEYGGVSRYFCELARRVGLAAGFAAEIFAPFYVNAYLSPSALVRSGIRVQKIPRIGRIYEATNKILSRGYLAAFEPDIVHETYYLGSRLAPKSCPIVITVYDMIHEKFPEMLDPRRTMSPIKQKAISRADRVICISNNTQRDLIELFAVPEDKTVVIPLGFGLESSDSAGPPQKSRREIPYLLYVGNRDSYKNFNAFLRAYATSAFLSSNFEVVAYGGGPFSAAELALIHQYKVPGKIVQQTGDDRDLADLYRGAAAFVYPSLYEGFGIPPLEAMSMDCPVVCSNTSSIPEVVGDAGLYFDPQQEDSMQLAIESVVSSALIRTNLIELGRAQIQKFSWDRCAAETLEVYSGLSAR